MTAVSRYAVFGHPIAHSLSPRLHALFAARAGIALDYTAIDAEPDKFEDTVRVFFASGGHGANVTLPHKLAAFALADRYTGTAQQLGVANVLTRLPEGHVEADSNDGAGMLADLRTRCLVDPHGAEVLLLGAGGAARAAAFALLGAGVRRLVIANRTFERARLLADALGQRDRVGLSEWGGLVLCAPFDLIINATSAGVQRARLFLPPSLADAHTVAYDLSYGRGADGFIGWAREAGCAAEHDGLGMLVETAAASFTRWHGVRPDIGAAMGALHTDATPPPDGLRC